MLYTNIRFAEKYDYLAEKFKLGYAFLRREDLPGLADGAYPLGQGVTANVQSYATDPAQEKRFETHDRFIDIQYIVSGEELFGVADRDTLTPDTPYDAEKDIAFYKTPAHQTDLYLRAGSFAVVTPEEGHQPGRAAGAASQVKKVVVKVPV